MLRILPALFLCLAQPVCAVAFGADPIGIREAPRAAAEAGISLDQAIAIAERRYQARVVRAETSQKNGQRIHVLRLLSEEGRVWTVRVDAATGTVK